jgi:hypothetical protein
MSVEQFAITFPPKQRVQRTYLDRKRRLSSEGTPSVNEAKKDGRMKKKMRHEDRSEGDRETEVDEPSMPFSKINRRRTPSLSSVHSVSTDVDEDKLAEAALLQPPFSALPDLPSARNTPSSSAPERPTHTPATSNSNHHRAGSARLVIRLPSRTPSKSPIEASPAEPQSQITRTGAWPSSLSKKPREQQVHTSPNKSRVPLGATVLCHCCRNKTAKRKIRCTNLSPQGDRCRMTWCERCMEKWYGFVLLCRLEIDRAR